MIGRPFASVVALIAAVTAISLRLAANQDPPAVAAGAALFQRSCASCHNVEGRAPSLATGNFAHGGADAQIAQTIRAGVAGTQMPPFPALSADEIRQLIAYIRSLSSTAAARTAATPPPTPTLTAAASPLTFERLRNAATEPQ